MYKKISHKIVEEHFEHPDVLPAGMCNYSSDPSVRRPMLSSLQTSFHNGSLGLHDPLPVYVMTDVTMIFRMDARTAWGKWAWSLLNYSISLNGNLPGTEQVKARLSKNAAALGEFIVPYYGITAGNVLGTALASVGTIGVEVVEATKAGQSIVEIQAKWKPVIDNLVRIMAELNPNNWPPALMSDIFTNLVNAWVEQLRARAAGDIVADEIAIDYINKLIITGLAKGDAHGYASLADLFSRGIIAQFPTIFAK